MSSGIPDLNNENRTLRNQLERCQERREMAEGLAEKLAPENASLKADNESLARKLRGAGQECDRLFKEAAQAKMERDEARENLRIASRIISSLSHLYASTFKDGSSGWAVSKWEFSPKTDDEGKGSIEMVGQWQKTE